MESSFDYVVVGGGSSGCVAAAKLLIQMRRQWRSAIGRLISSMERPRDRAYRLAERRLGCLYQSIGNRIADVSDGSEIAGNLRAPTCGS